MFKSKLALLSLCILAAGALSFSLAADKIKIEKLDDLPRYTYKISMKAVEFFDNEAAITKLSDELKRDLEKDLATYDIADRTTLQGYYATLGNIAFLKGDYDTYMSYLLKRRELEEKDATRLTMGLFGEAFVKAKKLGEANFHDNLKTELQKIVEPLPYEVVEANIKSAKGSSEIVSKNLMIGGVESSIQPILDKSNGEMSRDIAEGLLGNVFTLRNYLPNKDVVTEVYGAYIDAHQKEKADIWADRDVDLTAAKDLTPVILGVWDSGTDAAIFAPKNQLWVNAKEIAGNNKDDDNNGYVDDVNGIAYSLHSDKETSLLFDVGDVGSERPVLQRRLKGIEDLQANIDSPEAQELRKILSSLPQDSVKPFIEGLGKYGNYCHGTHVAGIAARNNPAARLLISRLTFDYHMLPELPTIEQAEKDAKAAHDVIEYFKKNGVRVVNMSWGGSLRSVEAALEANNAGGTPDERKALARKIYDITFKSLYDDIKNAPDILFLTSAGNADANVVFEEFYPSSFDLPNIMSIGAVDKAGDETSFTSFGKVDVYANGFEVLSYVPGGDEMKLSGTSMSSPNAMNLAGKLLAKNPKLTPAQLRKLIVDGSDDKKLGERTIKLINPKKSLELLAAMK